ncbi:MAG TPA: carboxypeptidase regulatory-like domain-containing protein [Xanthobacteraceae bacterium]|nr:carboxypeptidase regulatory-like domain-containing protein [Xanthobacteraceae bacterium]
MLAAIGALAILVIGPGPAQAADVLLSGSVTSAAGEKMGGVTVSAKADGQSITTSVFTDESGRYDFPPLAPGKYRVWAQALGYQTARNEVNLAASRQQDFVLQPMTDFVRQLPGDVLLAALPDATPEDARLKKLVRAECTSCHTASYILQHRFDEAGWSAIIELMKHVNVSGVYQGPEHKVNAILEFNQKALAAYLARARGPGESSMKIELPPRPAGEAARIVVREYDVPIDPELGPEKTLINDGSDWSLGTPSRSGSIVHDAWLDLDGVIWFTSNTPNHTTTIGRIDTRTGAYKPIKLPGQNGRAAQAHGMTRAPDGIIWFNANPGRGGLARLDPKTEQIQIYTPPPGMSPTGGATTVDYDGKGKIWVSAPDGALRFDPVSETFTEFKSLTFKGPTGARGTTYGVAADRDGNGWWAEMPIDIVGKGDAASGTSSEVKLAPVFEEMERATPEQRAVYDKFAPPDFNTAVPWAEGPRRMGTDKNADVLWVGNSYAARLARIDTHTMETTFVPLPGMNAPYHVAVDSHHDAWLNIWMTDKVLRFDPATSTWTTFELPSRGTESRYLSLDEHDGKLQVVVPYSRTSKVAVMSFRSEADIAALRGAAR